MRIHVNIIIFCVFFAAGIDFAGEPVPPTTGMAPSQTGLFRTRPQKAEGTPDEQTARAITTLLYKCEEQLDASMKSQGGDKDKFAAIYAAAWGVAITLTQQTHDANAKSWLMDQWSMAWKNPSYVPMLTSAMARVNADKSIVNKDILDAWKAAEDDATLRSMACWVAEWGTDEEAQFLATKAKSLKDPKKADILLNGLEWRDYWKNPDGNFPATGQPTPAY